MQQTGSQQKSQSLEDQEREFPESDETYPDETYPHETYPSEAQMEANRLNAQRSTGPRTQAGKNRSRMNTIAHGFTAQGVVLAEEDIPHYKAHLQNFKNEYSPKGPTEAFFVESLAEISWTVAKIRAQEQNFLTIVGQTGFNPFEGPDPEVNCLLAQANFSRPNAKHIDLLSRYEQRKMRVFRDSLRELKQQQLERKLASEQERKLASEQPQTLPESAQAANSAQASTASATQPAVHSENGFVCPAPKYVPTQAREIRPANPPPTI